jgi:2-polyprenyl-3-methyl-5-hydroxy-6-metoxy-1,4-benzoquinol methylase
MDERKLKTVSYYDTQAQNWSNSHGGDDKDSWWRKEMQIFHAYLPSGSLVEIGAGAGKDAESLIRLGYDYTGTDASVGLLKLAEKRNPSAKFIQRYVHEFEPSMGQYDGFWAAAVLLHIPREEIEGSLNAISSVLKTNGVGFITMKEGVGERLDSQTGRLFTYYTENEFSNHLENTGFTILEFQKRVTEKDTWLIFYVKKDSQSF